MNRNRVKIFLISLMFQNNLHFLDLNNLIEFVLQDGVTKVEEHFREIDQLNHGWLTVETLYQLLQKLDLSPAVTRDECRKLWPQFRLNTKNTLDWDEFLRHYMYSQE